MQVPILVQSVPKTGKLLVRFLGNPVGILVHRPKGKPFPCPGSHACQCHDFGKWKGYAPAQRWDQKSHKWLPVVFELTEGAVSCTGVEDLRGQGWEFVRVKTAYASQEVQGNRTSTYDSQALPQPFDVVPVVERLYGTRQIEWGVQAEAFSRPMGECSEDSPPIVNNRPTKEMISPEEQARIHDLFKKTGERMRSAEKKDPVANGVPPAGPASRKRGDV